LFPKLKTVDRTVHAVRHAIRATASDEDRARLLVMSSGPNRVPNLVTDLSPIEWFDAARQESLKLWPSVQTERAFPVESDRHQRRRSDILHRHVTIVDPADGEKESGRTRQNLPLSDSLCTVFRQMEADERTVAGPPRDDRPPCAGTDVVHLRVRPRAENMRCPGFGVCPDTHFDERCLRFRVLEREERFIVLEREPAEAPRSTERSSLEEAPCGAPVGTHPK
jgi:hypothetical protein